jgi:hypothetical protein
MLEEWEIGVIRKMKECASSSKEREPRECLGTRKAWKCRRADIFGWVAPPRFCVCRGNNEVAGEAIVCRGKKRLRRKSAWGVGTRRVEGESCPREHTSRSQIIANLSTVLCSTGTILRRKGNGNGQYYGKGKVKIRTLENRKGAAPKFVLPVKGVPPAVGQDAARFASHRSMSVTIWSSSEGP